MSLLRTEPPVWSRRNWWFMVALIFAAQLTFVLLLGARQVPVPRSAPPRGWLTLASPATELVLEDDVTLSDPTLFALMNRHGFSGLAWLKVPPLQHELAEWNESPRWLPPPVEGLASGFQLYVKTNAVVPFALVNILPPDMNLRPAPDKPLLNQSKLLVEGELQNRRLLTPPKLNNIEAADVLAASEVEIVVNRDGYVVSTRPAGGAGPGGAAQQLADQRALAATLRLQFEPVPRGPELTRGRIVIQWRTIEPQAPAPGTP